MGKIILGFDLDGVLYDWHRAVYTYYEYMMGYEGGFNEFWVKYIPSLSKEKQEYIVSLPFLYETSVPSDDVLNILAFAKENAESIYYITRRPDDVERVTRRYMRKYDYPYPDNLFITAEKETVCRYAGVTHFIDDFVKYVKAVDGISEAYLMAKPWNKEFQEDFRTVTSLKEFQEKVFI